jgi:hypothetical protein
MASQAYLVPSPQSGTKVTDTDTAICVVVHRVERECKKGFDGLEVEGLEVGMFIVYAPA